MDKRDVQILNFRCLDQLFEAIKLIDLAREEILKIKLPPEDVPEMWSQKIAHDLYANLYDVKESALTELMKANQREDLTEWLR